MEEMAEEDTRLSLAIIGNSMLQGLVDVWVGLTSTGVCGKADARNGVLRASNVT